MGFDNECILNIQSLAGEYFCPVCRLLVYPNEALQSQCTHLYCKPCLTYVVNTTQACPYDGYLVTEADSKPLTETNKSLAETIGKTPVHCLYHRSGCTWQGTLSACVSHCSGCAFGNSPVVCNRCGVQIVHRQVQEHAQTCPGVSAQAQAGVAAATSVAADQTRSSAAASQAGAVAVVVPGKEADQQSGSSSQRAQAVAQAAAPTAEQWYHQQQQQQYQQYYQQYPGYDQYQQQYQQYYPYQQQQHVPIPASLAQPQANQPQNQAQQVRPVIAQQTYPPAQQVRPYTQYQQARPQLQVQQQIQPNKTPNGNTQSQTQNPTALSVAGHASYPQPNTEPQQYPLLSQSQLASTHQTPSPVQALTRFPQQPQQMHLLHSHASISSQQQQVLFPPPGQVRNVPPGQQTVQQPYFQQPYFQQPGPVPPLQQTFPRQSLQHHTLRPLGQPRLFPAPMHSVASSHGAQHSNLSNPVGRPSMPSHGVQSQLYSQYVGGLSRPGFPGTYQQPTNQDNILKMPNQVQLPSEQQSRAKIDSEPKPSVVANTGAEIQTENSGSDMKPVGSENKVRDEGTKEPKHMQGEVNGVPVMKEGNAESTINHSNVGESHEVVTDDKKNVLDKGSEKINGSTTTVEEKETANGSQQINPPFQAHEQHEEHGGNLVKDSIRGSDNGSQEASSASAQVHDGFTEPPPPPPPPTLDQGKYQPLPSHYGPTTLPQRLAPPFLEPPHQTPPQTHFGPHVPGHPSGTSLARGPTQYNSMHSGAIGPLPSGALPPPPAFDPRGGTIARPTHGPDMFPNQRPFFVDGRQLAPNFPGSLEHGKLVPNMKIMNSFDSALPMGPRDERLLLHAERFNSFPAGPSRHMPDRMDFLDDMKQFPRPFDRGPHGLRYDPGLKIELGGVSSRFLSPYDVGSSSYSGERLGIRHENPLGRMEPSRGHLDFFGQGPALGRRHMDSLASRSPGREHLGMSRRGFRGPDSGDINGRELRRFGEPFPGPFPESRFSMLPSLLRRGEFEGPGRMGVGDRLRNDITGHDGFSSHLHGRDRIGNVYDELHLREPVGFGTRPHHARVTDIGGPLMDQFRGGDRPHYPHLGEPGFRSNFLLHGLPNDSGIITGEASFDISRKRKPPTTGWCRICKVDCETIEGLELHSQTREHQKMAMDIVVTIKQNAKRKKIGSGDQSSPRDASKSRNSGSEDRGKKN